MRYRPSSAEERGRAFRKIYFVLGSLLWVNGLFLSLAALWNGPLMAGIISFFGILAATLDAGKGTLGLYRKIFGPGFKSLPINQKAMWLGVSISATVNAQVIYEYFR